MGRWNGGYIRNFPLLPFWVPIAPTVLRVGGTHPPRIWYGGICHRSLTSLFLFSGRAPSFKNTAVRRRLRSKFWPNVWAFCSPVKRGPPWVECLFIFYEHRQRRHSFCNTGDRSIFKNRLVCTVVSRKKFLHMCHT